MLPGPIFHTFADSDRRLNLYQSCTITGLLLQENKTKEEHSTKRKTTPRAKNTRQGISHTLDLFHIIFGVFDMRCKHSFTHPPKYETGTSNLPSSFPLAMRLVATNLIVLCDAPEDRIAATRQALKRKGNPNEFNKMIYQGIGQLLCVC